VLYAGAWAYAYTEAARRSRPWLPLPFRRHGAGGVLAAQTAAASR
jgi:hypothetical protein